MRTTLEIDDDVLSAAKQEAKARGVSLGEVVSQLLRGSLAGRDVRPRMRNGVPLFEPASAGRPDLGLVNALRDEE